MGRRAKQKLHQQLHDFSNVLEYDRVAIAPALAALAGQYQRVVLEIGCGKGEYTVGLARLDPQSLYVGLDYQGERLWKGATTAQLDKLDNVVFIRGWADHLLQYVVVHSIDQIWLTFPDPFPKDKHENRRLTTPRYLNLYRQLLKPEGVLHLKTDSQDLHSYSKATLAANGWKVVLASTDMDKDSSQLPSQAMQVQTYFENLHRGQKEPITYLQATPA